jgi:hypothetical protein
LNGLDTGVTEGFEGLFGAKDGCTEGYAGLLADDGQ